MKKITFFICLLLFSFIGLNAQTITIGAGTSTQRYPLGNFYGYERSASLYTAAEIGSGGNIVNLSWQANTAGAARPIVVYLMETASSALTAGTWANQISGATQVYSGSVTPVVGWNTINLSVPFNYTGGSNNLMVLVEANFGGGGNSGGSSGNSVRYSTATSQHEYWQQDTTAPIANGTVSNNRPNVQITFGSPCSGSPVAGTVTPAFQNICSGTIPPSFVVSGSTSGVIGLTYQWEESTNSGGSWTNATGGAGATTLNYAPPAFAGTNIQYRLKVTCTNSGMFDYSTIADVQSAIAPATQASALNFTSTQYTNTTANWTNGSGSRRMVVVSNNASITDPVNSSGQPAITANALYAGSGQQIVYDGTGASVSVSGLVCNTTYYFKVYEYVRCGSGPYEYYYNVTSGTNAASVLTLQPSTATLPVNNNFSGFTGSNLSTVFPGWYESSIVTAIGSTPSDAAPAGATSGWINSSVLGSSAKLNLYTNSRNEWVISPKVSLTAASRLKFKAAITEFASGAVDSERMAGTDDKVDVLISADGCGLSWAVLHTFNAANTTTLTNVLTDYLFDLSAYTGQTVQIAFRGTDGPVDNAADYDFHIGNINIELVPTCEPPTALGANNLTSSSASLFWTAGGSETLWNIQWGPSGFALGTGTIVNGVANPHLLSGLSPITAYQYYVQTDCQANGTSTWAGPYSFITPCAAVNIPYLQDFESVTTPAIPACALVVNNGTGNVWATASAPGYGFTTKALTYVYHSTYSANTWFFTQGINLTAGTSYRISYNYGNNATNYVEKLKVAYGTSAASASMTNVLADHSAINQNAIQYNQIDFTPSATGVYYFGFQAYSGINQFNLSVDNISITVTPACSAPINVAASNVTHNSANISWGVVPSVSGYQYVLDANAADPAGSGTATTLATFNATPLSPLTTYYFHVRTDCSGTLSSWSTVSFTTLGTPPANDACVNAAVIAQLPYTNTQDATSATNNAGAISTCSSTSGMNDGVWYTFTVGTTGNITISLTGVTGWDPEVAVYSGGCGAFVCAGSVDNGAAGGAETLNLTALAPGQYWINIGHYSGTSDNAEGSLTIGLSGTAALLGNAQFDTAAFKAYPNPVKDVLNLSYATEISSVEVYNMLGQKVMTKLLNVAQGQIDLSNLNGGNYIVNVATADGLIKTIKVVKQ
ncbi:hypothetical protein FEDK69T_29670 [Flavobacterium enshiense DK69]|uniref:Fibronectin type-III domain-containing protein n=1 Tax=Flavobacterium enshiense DK69 TaxID=1107311 RepID=V6S2G6_9FLAO|nr:T9SS type A sorting domain-containing protein [Flavobacterium enshiense]ESU20447.1 hypothetical protein FEDK69T_29670 [Flavobacterium enshiense DK69]KGO95748.1 hypothetical protein Q767_08635 [Flavobacterium enshiense DK69]